MEKTDTLDTQICNLDVQTRDLLAESSLLMEEWSRTKCKAKPKGGMEEWAKDHRVDKSANCNWYHGTWQYLRLLDMVAVPGWHADFYRESLGGILRNKPEANVLISAAADYGMLATLHDAIESVGAEPSIVIYDICETPLASCQWYADRHGLTIKTCCGDLITGTIPEAPFDLIVTDEFLTVLKSEYKPLILKRWRELLRPGGAVVTVAMNGDVTTPALRFGYAERAKRLLENRNGDYLPNLKNGNKAALARRFTTFASYHTRHMIVDHNEIHGLFSEFDNLSLRRITTPGECVNPTDSFQIVASLST